MLILKHSITFIILFCLSSIILSSSCFAQEENIVALAEEVRPMVIKDPQTHEISGSAVSIVKSILKEANYKVRIEVYPWARAYETALGTKNTLIFPMGKTPKREELFHFIAFLYNSNSSFFKKSTSNLHITSLEDAKKYKICAVKEDIKTLFLKDKGFKNLLEQGLIENSLRDFLGDKCDFIIGSQAIVELTKNLGNEGLSVVADFNVDELRSGRYVAISKQSDAEVVKRLTDAAKKLRVDTAPQ